MKNKLILLLVGLVLGCADELQKDSINPNVNITSTFFKTEGDAISSINAVYNGLIVDGFYNRMGAVMADGRSDELTSRSPWDVLVTVSAFTMPSTSAGTPIIWQDGYSLITRANQTIEGVSGMTINADLKNRVLGQAYFLRAFAYYHLTTFYKDIPIVTKISVSADDRDPKTSPQADVWTQIRADLAQAITMLPLDYDNVSGADQGQKQRVGLGAAKTLLGRVNLYTQQWAAAESELDGVIALNKYSLTPNYADNFTENVGIENSNPEAIFSVVFTNDLSPDLNWGGVQPAATSRQFSAIAPTYGARGFGFFDFYPSAWLYSELKLEKTTAGKTDPRLLATILSYEPTDGYTKAYGIDWLTTPPAGAGYGASEIFVKKFTRADQGVVNETANLNSGINYLVLRYADVLLMDAEAKNEQGKTAAAAALITQVRNRAGLPDRTAEFAAYTQAQMRDQLAHERVTELGLEGSRINDIIRWGWLADPAKLALLKSHDIEFNTWQPGKEYLPIPQVELDRNKNLTPNSAN